MICADILEIEELKGVKLQAGEKGLGREVRWIYFGDALSSKDYANDVENWILGGEIVVFTNDYVLDFEPDYTKSIFERLYNMNIACIFIDEKYISPVFTEFCNSHDLPLFILPRNLRSVDFSLAVCTALIQEQTDTATTERILNSILFTGYDSEDRIISNAAYFGVDLHRDCAIAVFSPFDLSGYLEQHKISDKKAIAKVKNSYHKIVRKAFRLVCGKSVMSTISQDDVIVLHCCEGLTKEKYHRISEEIQREIDFSFNGMSFYIGVGNTCNEVSQLKKSYIEATKTARLCPVISTEEKLLFFNELGLYSLLFSIEDEKSLRRFYKKYLGRLMEYDDLNNAELCYTLESFLLNNQNSNTTAEALCVHRNTLRYRLDKIKGIIGDDLDNLSSAANYLVAFKIKKYLDSLTIDR